VNQNIVAMDEDAIPPLRDQISVRLIDRSSKPRWGLLLPVLIAANIVLSTVAWFLVSLFIQ
jgi:hypothetical protein